MKRSTPTGRSGSSTSTWYIRWTAEQNSNCNPNDRMTESRIALRYAKAVMEIAQADNSVGVVEEDFRTISNALRGSHDLRNFIESPVIDERTKDRILRAVFAGKLSPVM